MSSRTLARRAAATLLTTAVVSALTVAPALAETVNNFPGEAPAQPLSPLQALGLFVGIPLALTAVVSLLVMAPSWTRSGRTRPGLGWFAEPAWFHSRSAGLVPDTAAQLVAAPAPEATAGPAGTTAVLVDAALVDAAPVDAAPVRGTLEPLHTGGGASARW